MNFRNVELKPLHSTARKGAAIRTNHVAHNVTEGGDVKDFRHVTLLYWCCAKGWLESPK
jgi:hypothetical protein